MSEMSDGALFLILAMLFVVFIFALAQAIKMSLPKKKRTDRNNPDYWYWKYHKREESDREDSEDPED